ncbi:phosphoribosylanthranilate isomerase [Faecalicatena sp. AGMB00832]|uniref:N-(5'-phosphoribosyl)anthranilate isomerase n=1 Tax=Faecalicatena faecalis TaxID=2726362 RepID=A0ABS6D1S3_9FIRM|nr:phosphoribosylanthranilate isomerase [Faecalicatena faecalis]MBU3875142.1 phosphoribosylanthranilate isomerase [Faecalicatena faecalis]
MTRIKICGLKRPKDIEIINEVKPDFAGFVFAKSSRQIEERLAAELREKMDSAVKAVGVFVNEPIWRVAVIGRSEIIQMIQLHGDEDTSYIEELRMRVPEIPIIKAVRVRSGDDILKAAKLDVEYLLLDTFVKGVYGGSGIGFDKKLIPPVKKPYFLAGGLTAENVKENIRICHPFAVDTSSAMETDGIKDADKIRKFVERVRNNE